MSLDQQIQSIIARSASEMAKQIVHTVRQSIAAEIAGQTVAAPAKRGPGRPRKNGKPAASAAPAPKATPKRKAGKRRLISDAELAPVLSVITKKPGLTSVEIQKAVGIDAKQAARVLLKLRKTGKVKTKGEKSKATYTAA